MQVIVNGEARQLVDGITVRQLLEELQIPVTRVAVELNMVIVPKAGYGDKAIQDGDKIEIVHFVGGG